MATDKVRVTMFLESDRVARLKQMAKDGGQRTIQAVINMAIASYIRNWEAPEAKKFYPDGWPKNKKCPVRGCGGFHHPPTVHSGKALAAEEIKEAYRSLGLASPYGE